MITSREKNISLAFLVIALCSTLVLLPEIDLVVSGWFYDQPHHFFLSQLKFFLALHWIAVVGGWILGVLTIAGAGLAYFRRRSVVGIDTKGWCFLLLTLLLAPVFITNFILKDHWGRARPVMVSEFGGTHQFTAAGVMTHECDHNCSFVAGDPAFGFYLTNFAYVAARRRSRLLFWMGFSVGALFGIARIAMGSHFFSDVVFAGAVVIGVSAFVHSLFYGRKNTLSYWEKWLSFQKVNNR